MLHTLFEIAIQQYQYYRPISCSVRCIKAILIGTIVWLGLYAQPCLSESDRPIRLFVAKSSVDSGVVNRLLDDFQERYPKLPVELSSFGALEVLDRARRGMADMVITHHPFAEVQFMAEGFGVERTQIMYSEYVLLGPLDKIPKLRTVVSITEALKILATNEVDFIVPSPRSGTYNKIAELWLAAGIEPKWVGYESTGASGLATLRQAASMGAYTIVDMGTFLAYQDELDGVLVPLRRGDLALRNVYSALVVSKQKVIGAQQDKAMILYNYLIGPEAQDLIRSYGEQAFNSTFLVPAAHYDQELRLRYQQQQVKQRDAQLYQTRILLIGVVVTLFVIIILVFMIRRIELRRIKSERMNQKMATKLEFAEEAEKAKSLFFANINHELRTPLSAVLGYSELMMESVEENGHTGYLSDLEKIHGSAEHLLTIVNDILDLSKMEAGLLELYYEEFDIKKLVEHVENIASPMIEKNHNQLVIKTDVVVKNIKADFTRLAQILINLLSNAAKFTHDGTITLQITPAGKDQILFRVSDTGIGMTQDHIDKIFAPFQQAEASTAKKYGGTGLGLTICSNLVQLMKGKIGIHSVPHEGTSFDIIIPTGEQITVGASNEISFSRDLGQAF